jgi:Beta-propeller repeat
MKRTILFPIAVLITQAAVQASPLGQLADSGAASALSGVATARPGMDHPRTSPGGFEENKGQVKQTDGQPAPYVKFRMSENGANIFLLERGIAYQFNRTHDPEGYAELARKSRLSTEEEASLDELRKLRRLETYRMDMTLEGASPMARITTEGRSSDHTNYYLSGVEALDVHSFSKVIYHDVYPGIDWEIMTTEKGFEHDFIVHPGADPSVIKMRFSGHEELYVDEEGRLVHGNRLGRFVEAGPVSSQGNARVTTAFELQDDLLDFVVSAYDHAQTLRIDPTREWGTYYGGAGDDWAKDLACDPDGNVFMVGYTASSGTNVIATTTGVFDPSYNLGQDGFLVKFDPDGSRLWGTYYGGSNDDYLVSCAVRGNDVVAAGTSESPDLGTSGTQQPTFAFSADGDGLLVNFSTEDGSRNWAIWQGRPARRQEAVIRSLFRAFKCNCKKNRTSSSPSLIRSANGSGERTTEGTVTTLSPIRMSPPT